MSTIVQALVIRRLGQLKKDEQETLRTAIGTISGSVRRKAEHWRRGLRPKVGRNRCRVRGFLGSSGQLGENKAGYRADPEIREHSLCLRMTYNHFSGVRTALVVGYH